MGPPFPQITERLVQNDLEGLKALIRVFVRTVSFAIIPLMVAIMILRVPIVATLLQRGNFTREATELTAHLILFAAPSMVFLPLSSILFLVFLANDQSRLLAKLSVVFVGSNLLLCVFLMHFLGLAGIALGTTVLYAGQILVCGRLVQRAIGNFELRELMAPISKILVSSLVVALCMHAGLQLSAGVEIPWASILPLARVCVLGLIGGMVYFLTCYVLKVEEVRSGLKEIQKYVRG